jgi:hypothetical protein
MKEKCKNIDFICCYSKGWKTIEGVRPGLETGHEKVVRIFLEPTRPDSTLAQPDPGPRDISFTEFFLAYRIGRSLR